MELKAFRLYHRVLKGDSGGPLVCLKDNTFVVYGVVSFSLRKCSDLTDRQAFTKVTQYLQWLKNTAAKLKA
ncbi:hypothetical protein D918_00326 [Trichuris suis]|nr:hypothetical protein D918_00326 [Trichuris suis]